MSGLKLNIDKTKAIWIGAASKSKNRLCHEYNLDWNQEPFKVLGTIFTTEVFDIWEKNATAIFKCILGLFQLNIGTPGRRHFNKLLS